MVDVTVHEGTVVSILFYRQSAIHVVPTGLKDNSYGCSPVECMAAWSIMGMLRKALLNCHDITGITPLLGFKTNTIGRSKLVGWCHHHTEVHH